MKPAVFDMKFPTTIEAALDELAEAGADGRAIAGGQSLVPLLNFRMSTPSVLVDLGGIDELRYVQTDRQGQVRIGAMTTLTQLARSAELAESHPVLIEGIRHVAHSPIRNRATLGGSLAHADPSAEMPAMALLLDATLVASSLTGRREIAAADFFQGPYSTALREGELLTEIRLPAMPAGSGAAIEEVARRTGDFALAGAFAMVTLDAARAIRALRVVVFAAATRPTSLTAVDAASVGSVFDETLVDRVATQYAEQIAATADLHASAAFRSHLTGVVAGRALRAAGARA